VERQHRWQDPSAEPSFRPGTGKSREGGGTYHAFLRLSQELIEVNGRICQLRPVRKLEDENELEQLKKNCGGISPRSGRRSRSSDQLIGRVLQDRQRLGHLDLEASEMAIRAAMHQMGGVLLEKLLNSDGGGYRGAHMDCSQGHPAEFVGYRGKQILTVLSSVDVQRAYYHCAHCESGWVPKDQELDVVGSSFSPRSFKCRRNDLQLAWSSFDPSATASTSRKPSSFTPIATSSDTFHTSPPQLRFNHKPSRDT
jgi:hypothetical protein